MCTVFTGTYCQTTKCQRTLSKGPRVCCCCKLHLLLRESLAPGERGSLLSKMGAPGLPLLSSAYPLLAWVLAWEVSFQAKKSYSCIYWAA